MNFKKYVSVVLLSISSLYAKPSAVTYDFSGGRFGDNLLAYSHARWIAYKHDIPFLYRPFNYSDQLEMKLCHPYLDMEDDAKTFDKVVHFKELEGKHNKLDIQKDGNILYVIPYFPEVESDLLGRFHFDTDWNDPGFKAILKKEFKNLYPLTSLEVPNDKLLVAVHVRTGAGFDKVFQLRTAEELEEEMSSQLKITLQDIAQDAQKNKGTGNLKTVGKSKFCDKQHPMKFPPYSYYIEEIKHMSELLNDKPMYVFIFTDSPDPQIIADLFAKYVNKPNIEFGYRSQGNQHDANVLDDFFALTQFDYLIRGRSNFPVMAEKIADYEMVISPLDAAWYRKTLKITKSEVIYKQHPLLTMKNISIASILGLGLYWGINKLQG